jgi:hypothetical protein
MKSQHVKFKNVERLTGLPGKTPEATKKQPP